MGSALSFENQKLARNAVKPYRFILIPAHIHPGKGGVFCGR